MTSAITFAALVIAGAVSALRWLRVAQREHYLAGSTTRFAFRWWKLPNNALLALVAVVATVAIAIEPLIGLVTAGVIAIGPIGLSIRGRSGALAWTRRLKTIATVVIGINLVALGLGIGLSIGLGTGLDALVWPEALFTIAMPFVIDGALMITAPLERRLARRFIDQASKALHEIDPVIIAITGSYGKTTIKNYVAHLLGDTRRVVASPASFNNAAGISRTVNEQLVSGTEVFVAEMGTYGPGEIRNMCSWVQPDISVICAIGPMHLERMGSLDAIVSAKSEIVEPANVVVLNIDAHGLAALGDQCEAKGKTVVRYSTHNDQIVIDGESITTQDLNDAHSSNVACALAVTKALALLQGTLSQGDTFHYPIDLLGNLPVVAHRQTVSVAESGVTIIDDTFNSNPVGSRAALALLSRHGDPGGSKVVVTPGMVELGPIAFEENSSFAADALGCADHLIIVGKTNRRALLAGAARVAGAGNVVRSNVLTVSTRDEALAWVRANLKSGDVVLWENDLPDHFP